MLVIIILFVTGLSIMFTGLSNNKSVGKVLGIVGITIAISTMILKRGIGIEFPMFFSFTPLAKMMTVLSLVIMLLILLVSDFQDSDESSSVLSLMFFSVCGAVLLFGYSHLLTLFLGIEILSIPFYVMAASKKAKASSLEAGLKYFILGSFSSAFLLFGIALIYGTFGSFHIDRIIEVQNMLTSQGLPPYFMIGMLMIIISILFKMALAPFHFWSPDVYDGSPTLITAFMATIVKVAGTVAMYYLLAGFFAPQFSSYVKFLLPVIFISLLLGGIMGLVQKNVKRMLAYSSITHAGFILSSIVVGIATQNPFIITFYLMAYTIANLLAFIILNEWRNGEDVFLDHLNGLGKKSPWLGFGLSLAVLSMAGIPFTGGFMAKYVVLRDMYIFNKWLFGFALLSSAIGIGYYLRVVNRIYFYENNTENVAKTNLVVVGTCIVLSIIILVFGIFPTLIPSAIQTLFFQ